MGKQVFLDPERFIIRGNKIHVLSDVVLEPAHFAGAEFFVPEDFIDVDVLVDTLQPLTPPIQFHEADGVIHLMCDLFRNSWMVSQRQELVPVPCVNERTTVMPNSSEWLSAAAGTVSGLGMLLEELEKDTGDLLPRQ